jgi:hypothetical protein
MTPISPAHAPAAHALCVVPEAIVTKPGGAPRVELELHRSQYPPDVHAVFQPLRLPDRCEVQLCGPLVRSLRGAELRVTVQLRPGLYHLPIGSGAPFEVEVPAGGQAFARIEIGERSYGEGRAAPVVRAVDLQFAPALALHNVLRTLGQVQELVDDPRLAPFRALGPLVPSWMRSIGGLAVGSMDSTGVVHLELASARAQPPSGLEEPTLRFAFSGHVRWFDQLETAFVQIALPSPILPIPWASLERLTSSTPLATADLSDLPPQPLDLLRTLLEMAEHVEGDVGLELEPPPLGLRAQTVEGTRIEAELRLPPRVRLHGKIAAVVEGTRLELRGDDLCLDEVTGGGASTPGLRLGLRGSVTLDLEPGDLAPRDRVAVGLEIDLRPESRVSEVVVAVHTAEPLARGGTDAPLRLSDLTLQGSAALVLDRDQLTLRPASELRLRGAITSEALRMESAVSTSATQLRGELDASVRPLPDGEWQAEAHVAGELSSHVETTVSGLPELDIHRGALTAQLEGRLQLDARALLRVGPHNALEVDLAGTRFAVALDALALEHHQRRLTVPRGTQLSGAIRDGLITPAGLRMLAVDLSWDMHGQPTLLHHGEQSVSLLTDDLRQGQVTLLLDSAGRMSFSGGRDGLYGVRYFNALINPAGDPDHLLDLFLSEDALSHVLGGLSVFAPAMAEALTDLRALYLGARRILKREGIREPRDFIPRRAMARVMSLLLAGDGSLQERLVPIIRRVTEGHGLDVAATKELLLQHLGEFDIDYEITTLLGWLDLVLSPSEPLEPAHAEPELPLAEDPAYRAAYADLPSAAEIYDAINRGDLDKHWARRLADLAPLLTGAQLGFILERATAEWDPLVLARLRYAHEIKRRVAQISEGYGGAEYALQPWVIATFLGEAVGPLPGINHPIRLEERTWPPPCTLGPEDVAVLLRAGLAAGRQDRRSQINNRLLLELLRRQPPSFTREVMVELGDQSSRALSGILYAFLDQDQDQMADPLDLVALLGEKLGVPVPRQRDFMAGGHKARQSYYEALSRLSDQIFDEANPYLARKAHLQVMRHQVPPALVVRPDLADLEERARLSVVRADEVGGRCSFERDDRGGPRRRARDAFAAAFRACARLLEREPRAFQLPWLRAFWLRNEEALRVLSVVRNHQQDVDRVRYWLTVQCKRDVFDGEQDLLQTVVRSLYWERRHQEELLADPLVRLLIDPPPGKYDFSVVSCMGVITDGADGKELIDAWRRLEEQRGVRLIRAATGTAWSLERNAVKIIEAIASCTTPWGIIGYSQGCANALMAESMLYGGTPEQQRLLDDMVCRNMLFSAVNGSAHGTSGMIKFLHALVLGERSLKHYQAVYSWEAIQAVLRVVKAALDSHPFVHILGGAHSLSFERARVLHRDEQFLDRVPTSLTRGVVTDDRLPETLEYLYYVLREMTHGAEQDTQVLITDAIGSSTRVINDNTAVLTRCDMATHPQATHHWAPLTVEVEFVKTERDRALAIYDSPKDRLVWPWVEVNARFGRIRGG